ncbi:DUF4190 domain-containing protein [Cellulomonas sp. PhB143]|uniref:DUF4190 domain-containing protein n=1 Tax=Cellulomonas sp. PhB143 TaxID=2485186 RepID=UPI000F47CAC1|nr:DUF4190 domain-containing protein [Cellulomonas sp. PhB143]ROS76479.1 putative regulator of septum formation [Cellulomonas sp. PhB143]
MTSPTPAIEGPEASEASGRTADPAAVAALCLAVVVPPAGVALGVVGLRRARRDGRPGAGLAVAGIVVGVAVTLFWVVTIAVGVAHGRATTPLDGDVAAPVSAHARRLVVGSCLGPVPDDARVTRVDVVPCAAPHSAQVLARTDWTDDTLWPGADGVRSATSRVCGADELTADGVDPGDVDRYERRVWTPSEASWRDGDRTGLCVATPTGGPERGSLVDPR